MPRKVKRSPSQKPSQMNLLAIEEQDATAAVLFLDRYRSMMGDETFRSYEQKTRYNLVAKNYYPVNAYRQMPEGVKRFISCCATRCKKERNKSLEIVSRHLREDIRKASEILYRQYLYEIEGYYLKFVLPKKWEETMKERIAAWGEDIGKYPHLLPPEQSL